MGSAPFRGNLKPTNVESLMKEYPSVQTFTVQSAFSTITPMTRYAAGSEDRTREALFGRRGRRGALQNIIERCANSYREQIIKLAPLVNEAANYVPARRKRKLHIGLFGYSRSLEGIKLPRAISFCCAFYSLGIPPEYWDWTLWTIPT